MSHQDHQELLPRSVSCVILGAGHAGLAVSYELTQRSVPHLVLERGHIAETWRGKRWDNFLMIMPNWGLDLPGFPYDGDRDAFTDRDTFVRYLERYAASFNAPVRTGVTVQAITPTVNDDSPFLVESDHGSIETRTVVIATGIYQVPRIPAFAAKLPADIAQLTPDTYHNAEQPPPGAVLVAGTGASGTQITEDLYVAGRKVFLATGRAGRLPRRYRGIDTSRWARFPGINQSEGDRGPDAGGQAHRTGRGWDHDINLHRFARDGVTLLGRIDNLAPDNPAVLQIRRDLHANLAYADDFDRRFRIKADAYVAETGLDTEPPTPRPDDDLRDGFEQPERDRLDLRAENIQTIIWAIGYDQDYAVVRFPIFGEDGHPIHDWGVTAVPGLYFAGMTWRGERPKTSFIGVIAPEAAHIADEIAARRMAKCALSVSATQPS